MAYVPFGEEKEIELTVGMVGKFLCTPTKSGKMPNKNDIIKFMMLCQSRELNPWVGDAYLVGYDSNDGPQFSLITAVQALHKRAEVNPQYDGLEAGLIILRGEEIVHREGACGPLTGEKLLGGWSRVYRKDRRLHFYAEVKLETYSTGRSRWAKDQGGMIRKVAVAAALREAFPTQVGGLYIREEMVDDGPPQQTTNAGDDVQQGRMAELAQELKQRLAGRSEDAADEVPAQEAATDVVDMGESWEEVEEPEEPPKARKGTSKTASLVEVAELHEKYSKSLIRAAKDGRSAIIDVMEEIRGDDRLSSDALHTLDARANELLDSL